MPQVGQSGKTAGGNRILAGRMDTLCFQTDVLVALYGFSVRAAGLAFCTQLLTRQRDICGQYLPVLAIQSEAARRDFSVILYLLVHEYTRVIERERVHS